MSAAELNLIDDPSTGECLAIQQGYDYGPIQFRIRDSDFETLTLEITDVGSAGDTISLALFGTNSDRPEVALTLTHTVTAADTTTTVAAAIAVLINAVRQIYIPPEPGDTEAFEFVATSDGAIVTFETTESGFHIDASRSVTGAATATLTVTVDVLVDLTAATIEATGKDQPADTVERFNWTTGVEFTISDAARGVVDLDVPRATTLLYAWQSTQWEMSVLTSDDRRSKYFFGRVENMLTRQ